MIIPPRLCLEEAFAVLPPVCQALAGSNAKSLVWFFYLLLLVATAYAKTPGSARRSRDRN